MISPKAGRGAAVHRFAVLLLASTAIAGISGPASAQTSDAPVKTAPKGSGATVESVTVLAPAMRVSVGNVPLEVTEPTSAVPQGFIQNNIIPLSSFDDIIKFQPSVFAQTPNGPGMGKNEILSIRGFQDGQYNVTFDGIPFGDASDLHHTSSALFISHDLDAAEVDRGPGTASTIGKATFGGTVGFRTKGAADDWSINPYATIGSFNTYAGGLELESGKTPLGHGFIDYQHETTDGYLSYSGERRTNLLGKWQVDLSDRTSLTVLGTWNHAFEYNTAGATLAEIAQFGPNYALCNNRALQCYYGYQGSDYYSDFEYIDLKTDLGGGWKLNNKVYSDAFTHGGSNHGGYTAAKDATDINPADNGVSPFDSTGKKLPALPNDIGGKVSRASFRAWGDIVQLKKEFSFGDLLTGFWFDQNYDNRWSQSIDLTTNQLVNSKFGTTYTYDFQRDVGTTAQPYVEFDWRPTEDLVVKPGVKYTLFDRSVSATANKTSPPTPISFEVKYTDVEPSISVNYTIQPGWTAYGQIAKGFLAPPINVLETQNIGSIQPEETINYQLGTATHQGAWQLGADVYYIDFSNYLATSIVNAGGTVGNQSTYINSGGAIYKGVEFEGQYAFGHGFSGYANYSVNSAKYKGTDVTLAESPKWLGAVGLLYDQREGPYGSLVAKFVGPHFGLDNVAGANGQPSFVDQFPINSFWFMDLAAGYKFRNTDSANFLKGATVSVKISNLFDSHKVDDFEGTQSVSGTPTYRVIAGRSVFLNLEASF
jgi:iron complex outermembrane receptor protein